MSEIIGLCGGCLYSGGYKDLWYDKDNVLHCNAYPDGVPAKVMKRMKKTGYCPRRDKLMEEIYIAEEKKMKEKIEKEIEAELKKLKI